MVNMVNIIIIFNNYILIETNKAYEFTANIEVFLVMYDNLYLSNKEMARSADHLVIYIPRMSVPRNFAEM
jgi:hypothetical protein